MEPQTSTIWYERILNDPVNLTSIGIGLISVVLGIIPLILYFGEKKSNRQLNALIQEFNTFDAVRRKREKEEEHHKKLDKEIEEAKTALVKFEEDLTVRLPNAAKIAYLENTIPALDQQIYNIGKQREYMEKELIALGAEPKISTEGVNNILSKTVSEKLKAQRSLEQYQTFLVIFTTITSALISITPYELNIISAPFALASVALAIHMAKIAKTVHQDNKLLNLPWEKIGVISSLGITVLGLAAFLAAYKLSR